MKTSFPRRRSGGAAVAAALLAVSGLTLAACSSPAHPAASATIAITPGSGQSSLAGMPGSTATGPVTQPPSAAGSMPAMSMPASAAPTPAGVPVATDSVAIKNFAFAPAAITVKVGTRVTWTNQDSDAHTVTSQNNTGPLNSQALNTGQSFSYTFTTPGTYHYLCTIHPFMTATVTVTR
ncbi:plastocyanin [Streptacidiphilus pinicola]|uniref:Plastocyanin n=1 Tax=Streptacidiphilus pinicola TaxID=2219663 RepID=A0A2X0IUN6_9ACTN|nr:cupredoxin family copper-binding protein [Streptacidiphilus pinicola]RAG81276.1 plastocyanin [Streptacidiphilus pinicola]